MRSTDIREEAERLVREDGPEAFSAARAAMREAGQLGDRQLETYWDEVSREVAWLQVGK